MGAYTAFFAAFRKPERVAMIISEDTYVKSSSHEHIIHCRDYLRELSNSFLKIPSYMDEEEAHKKIAHDMFAELSEEIKKKTPEDLLHKQLFPFKRDADGRYTANFNEKSLYRIYSDPASFLLDTVGSYEGPAVFLVGTKSYMNLTTPVNLAYDLYESTEGSNPNLTPIVLLHGLASDRKTWKHFAPIIAKKTKRKVYAYDARNYGDSEYTDDFSSSLNVDDLFHFMNIIKANKAVLFGHSMGGYTAVNAALRKPERVAMIISEDTYVKSASHELVIHCRDYLREISNSFLKIPSYMAEEEAKRKIIDDMFAELSEENEECTPKDILYKLHSPFKRDADGRYTANFNEKSLYRIYSDPASVLLDPVGLYDGPAVFFIGTKSPMNLRSHMPHIRGHFPNVEFIEFEGGYHNLHAQFREETADTVVQVLNKYNIS
nr:abhydrolase domain-containing protein C22H12.03-like [Parasteatoda tepidariorum]